MKCQFGSLLQTWKKKSISKQTRFFVEFELDFYYLCSLQKSISKTNWFFDFLNLIFRNWKKIEWHLIFQKSSGDRQGVCPLPLTPQFLPSSTDPARWVGEGSSEIPVVRFFTVTPWDFLFKCKDWMSQKPETEQILRSHTNKDIIQ